MCKHIGLFHRWLVSQGQIEKAVVICKKFERINKMKVDPQIYEKFTVSNNIILMFPIEST